MLDYNAAAFGMSAAILICGGVASGGQSWTMTTACRWMC